MTRGWGYVDTMTGGSHKAHYFENDGRSLCGKWLALGTPRWLLNQAVEQRHPKTHCVSCWRKGVTRAADGHY